MAAYVFGFGETIGYCFERPLVWGRYLANKYDSDMSFQTWLMTATPPNFFFDDMAAYAMGSLRSFGNSIPFVKTAKLHQAVEMFNRAANMQILDEFGVGSAFQENSLGNKLGSYISQLFNKGIGRQDRWLKIQLNSMSPLEYKLLRDVLNSDKVLIGRSITIKSIGESNNMFVFDTWLESHGITWKQNWQDVFNRALYERASMGKSISIMSAGKAGYTLGELKAAEEGIITFWP